MLTEPLRAFALKYLRAHPNSECVATANSTQPSWHSWIAGHFQRMRTKEATASVCGCSKAVETSNVLQEKKTKNDKRGL